MSATTSSTLGSGPGSRLPPWLLSSGVIALAMGVMNVTTYGFTVVAARWLGPPEYGQLAAAMGLLLILNVLSLGLQATGARRISSAPSLVRQTRHEVMVASYKASALLGGLTLLLVPVLAGLLRLELGVAALVALAAIPLTVMGGQAGVLQGERRWLPLALLYAGMGLGRLAAGAVALTLQASATSAMAAVAVGALVPAGIGAAALRRTPGVPAAQQSSGAPASGSPASGPPVLEAPARSVLTEVLHNSHALLAFFALSNCDVLVARAVLGDHLSGLYAGGLILTKAVLFLPQFVVVLVFPSMSADTARRGVQSRALGLILAMGLVAVGTAVALPWLAVLFVGGAAYAELEPLVWAFAVLGTLLALIQLLVYAVVARQHTLGVFVIWGGLAVMVACSPLIESVPALLWAMGLTLAGVLLGLLTLMTLMQSRRRTPPTAPDPSSVATVEP